MSVTQEALYLRYRPKRFQDVVEQDAVKRILSEELKTGRLKRCLKTVNKLKRVLIIFLNITASYKKF